MKKEPCIRLGMRIRPKIREKPADSRNKRPPRARLLIARMAACADVICVIMNGLSSDPRNATRLDNRHARNPGSFQWIPGSQTGNATDEQLPLFQMLRRRIVAPVDFFRQEALLVIGPELADIRVGLDNGIDELSAFALALADEDIADNVAIAVETHRAA